MDDKNKARCISVTAVAKANRFATLLRCMKQHHNCFILYLHREIPKHFIFKKGSLRNTALVVCLKDQPYPTLNSSYYLVCITKKTTKEKLCCVLVYRVSSAFKALERKSVNQLCQNYRWHEKGFCFQSLSHDLYFRYFAQLLEDFSGGGFQPVCSLPLEKYFRFRHFRHSSLPWFSVDIPSSRKKSAFQKNVNILRMKPSPSCLDYVLKRQVFVGNRSLQSVSLRNDLVSICAPLVCSRIEPRFILHDHDDLVASLKFIPSSHLLCSFALDDKIRVFQGAHCHSVLSGPLQQTGGTIVSDEQVAACSLRAELGIFDIRRGERISSMFAPSSLILPKGRIEWYTITSSWNSFIATGGNYGVVALWDSRASLPVEFFQANMKPEEQKIRSVAIDPTETLLSAACGRTVHIWDIRRSISILKTIPLSSQGPIDHILFDPLSSFKLYAGHRDGSIHSLNILKENKPIEKIFNEHEAPSVANRPVSVNFDISPDGRHLFGLAHFGKVAIYDVFGDTPNTDSRSFNQSSAALSTSPTGEYSTKRRRKISSFLGTLGDASSELVRIATAHNLSCASDILFATASTSLDVTLWGMK